MPAAAVVALVHQQQVRGPAPTRWATGGEAAAMVALARRSALSTAGFAGSEFWDETKTRMKANPRRREAVPPTSQHPVGVLLGRLHVSDSPTKLRVKIPPFIIFFWPQTKNISVFKPLYYTHSFQKQWPANSQSKWIVQNSFVYICEFTEFQKCIKPYLFPL